MSVYIKGMDIPKRCAECTFETLFSDDMHYCAVEEILTEDYRDYRECRPPLCPLVEVKAPHGRLVDADMAYQETMAYGEHFRKSVLKVIGNLPTVIERSIGEVRKND